MENSVKSCKRVGTVINKNQKWQKSLKKAKKTKK